MYGFQPKHARAKAPAQKLADGGLVHSIKGMMGMRPKTREELLAADAKNQARNQEAAARVAARAAQQPAAAAPAPQSAITDYAGMSATQRREKEQGLADGGLVAKMKSADAGAAPFGSRGLSQLREMAPKMQAMGFGPAKADAPANDRGAAGLKAMIPQMEAMGFKQAQAAADGGMIRGPGTGTSDSIPDKMAPGTFIMPADSTEALGLDDELAEGEKVPVRVSNGEFELPPERVQAVGAAVLQAIKGMTHTPTSQAGEGEPMARGFKPKGEPPQQFFFKGGEVKSPEELAQMQKQTSMYVQGAQAAAASRPAAPPVAPTPAPAPAQPSEYGRQMREIGGALADGASWLGKTIVSAPGYGFNKPSAAPAVQSAAGGGRGSINPAPVTPSQPAPTTADPTTATTTDAPTQDANESTPGPGPLSFGEVNPQNDGAAQALSATPAAPAGFQPRGVPAPTVRNSTNDWAARKQLENLATGASSITNTPEWSRGATTNWRGQQVRGQADQDGKVSAYQAALKSDLAMQQAQPGMDQAAMRENAGLQREGLQQDGANTRAGMQEAGAAAREAGRTALAGQELGMRREAQGFQTRAAAQLENLQAKYTAEKDPAKQAEIARQIRALQGKTDPAEWAVQVTPTTKNPDGSTSEGSVIRYNKATGQAERVDVGGTTSKAQGGAPAQPTSKAEYDALPKGAQYVKNGVVYVKG